MNKVKAYLWGYQITTNHSSLFAVLIQLYHPSQTGPVLQSKCLWFWDEFQMWKTQRTITRVVLLRILRPTCFKCGETYRTLGHLPDVENPDIVDNHLKQCWTILCGSIPKLYGTDLSLWKLSNASFRPLLRWHPLYIQHILLKWDFYRCVTFISDLGSACPPGLQLWLHRPLFDRGNHLLGKT